MYYFIKISNIQHNTAHLHPQGTFVISSILRAYYMEFRYHNDRECSSFDSASLDIIFNSEIVVLGF